MGEWVPMVFFLIYFFTNHSEIDYQNEKILRWPRLCVVNVTTVVGNKVMKRVSENTTVENNSRCSERASHHLHGRTVSELSLLRWEFDGGHYTATESAWSPWTTAKLDGQWSTAFENSHEEDQQQALIVLGRFLQRAVQCVRSQGTILDRNLPRLRKIRQIVIVSFGGVRWNMLCCVAPCFLGH